MMPLADIQLLFETLMQRTRECANAKSARMAPKIATHLRNFFGNLRKRSLKNMLHCKITDAGTAVLDSAERAP
jgi:hypothetical protein